MKQYTLGFDFGSLSARGVLMDLETGVCVAAAEYEYPHGILSDKLPDGTGLGTDWALHDPDDYWQALPVICHAILHDTAIAPQQIVGIGIDTTACTILPTTSDGMPLCQLQQYRNEPHAYVKLWKHHAAQPYTEEIEQLAKIKDEPWLVQCGGQISCEHYLPKMLQIVREAPQIYTDAARIIQVGDWLVWKLTGNETRGYCTAAFKTFYSDAHGDVSREFLMELDPLLGQLHDKQPAAVLRDGCIAGRLTTDAAQWMGLNPSTAVSAAAVDGHVTVLGSHINTSDDLLMIIGTSACQIMQSEQFREVQGLNGTVYEGILPDLYTYEGGQSCVGDIFAWYVDNCVPEQYVQQAKSEGEEIHSYLMERAAALRPGANGLIALDWWNGVRSTLMDFDLSGLLIGMTLDTSPVDIYRALLESTAFGARTVIDAMTAQGLQVETLYATGGIPHKNPLLMQIYADVCNRELCIVDEKQTGARGSAILGAAASLGGLEGFRLLPSLIERYKKPCTVVYHPNPNAAAVYDRMYKLYRELYELFGSNSLMKRLKTIKTDSQQPL